MDDDDDTDPDSDLVALLGTRIGTIMEDCSVVALGFATMDSSRRLSALSELERASQDIAALAGAMRSLMRGE